MRVSLLGTMNVLEAALAAGGVKRLIDFSTSEVFGRYAYNVTEWDATTLGAVGEARWTYAVAKLATEHLAMNYWKQYKLPTVSVRPFNIYGPRQVGEGAVHHFIVRALRGQPLVRAQRRLADPRLVLRGRHRGRHHAGARPRRGGRPRLQHRQSALHAHHLHAWPRRSSAWPRARRTSSTCRGTRPTSSCASPTSTRPGSFCTSRPRSIWKRACCAPSTGTGGTLMARKETNREEQRSGDGMVEQAIPARGASRRQAYLTSLRSSVSPCSSLRSRGLP